MAGVLEGIVVLDLSREIAGSYAAMLLAEQGADCIKIEAPDTPSPRPPTMALFDRSKRSLTLAVESTVGRAVLEKMLARADIIIHDMGLTRARQLGLDYASLSKVHSRLVFCGITPFGENGPLSLKPADDNVVAAFSGTIAAQGGLGQPPVFVFIPLASYATAMLTAYGASLALFVREATGKGQQVHASLLGGTLAMDSGAFLSSPKIVAVPLTRGVQQGAAPAYRLYECADGEWIMIACGNTTFWNKLCLALDRTELLSDARFQGMPWGLLDIDSRLALTEILGGILQQHSRVYWLELLSANDVPCSPVITRQEFMDDPQVKHNGMMVTVRDPYYGDMRQPGIPITLTGNPSAIKCPAPVKGQHTGVILAGFGYSPAQVRELDRKGAI